MGWVHMAQDGVQWRDVVNRVLDLPVPYTVQRGSSRATVGFSKKDCPVELFIGPIKFTRRMDQTLGFSHKPHVVTRMGALRNVGCISHQSILSLSLLKMFCCVVHIYARQDIHTHLIFRRDRATIVAVESISVTYSQSLRYPACNAHAPYCYLWPARLSSIFPHYLINGTIFEKKKVIEHEMCVSIFSANFV